MIKKRYLINIIIFFILLYVTCFKKPQWEVPLTIPLLSKTYSVTSLLDTNDFNIGLDSSINFSISGSIDSVFLLDSFKLENLSDTNYSSLSDFVINNLFGDSAHLDAEEVTGQQLQDTSTYIMVAPINLLFNRTLNLTNIRNVSIATCVARLNITNGTRLYFDSVICQINNLASIPIYSFDSLSTITISHRFENFNLDSIASFNISVYSPGTGNDSILASTRDSIDFVITFDSLRINSGRFRAVPPKIIRKSKERIYSLPSNYAIRINELIFRSGDLQVNLDNYFPLFCSLQVTIPELSFDTLVLLPAYDSAYCELSLANRTYHNTSDSLTPITLRTLLSVLLDSFYVDVDPQNYINVQYQISDILIDSLAGTIIDTIEQNFSSDTIEINLPEFLSQVQTVNALAMLEVSNAISFPMLLNLNIQTKNAQGDSAAIDTIFHVLAGTPNNPVVSSLVVNFNNLININPNQAVFNATLSSFGDGWLNRQSFTTAAYTIMSPLQVMLRADTIYFDPTQINIAENIRDIIMNNIDTATFYAQIQNHIPTRLTGQFVLENQIHDSVNINITIPSGIINNLGYVTSPVDTNLAIVLSEQETQIFADSIINVSVIFYLPDTDTIVITGRDYLKIVNSYVTIQTQIPPK